MLSFFYSAIDYVLSSFTSFKVWLYRKTFSGYYRFDLHEHAIRHTWLSQKNRSVFSRILDYIAYGSSPFYTVYDCFKNPSKNWHQNLESTITIYDGQLVYNPFSTQDYETSKRFKLVDKGIQSVWLLFGDDTYIDVTDSVAYLLEQNLGVIYPVLYIPWILEVNGIKLTGLFMEEPPLESIEVSLEIKYQPDCPKNPFRKPKADFVSWDIKLE